jgi:putative thioredoxin
MYIDVTDATFATEVVERSKSVPVVVDLWAPWCGPCRTLGPLIERVIDATGGAVVLVKINVDDNPRASATFQVQSIPAVFAVHEGKVIDSFIGALPEAQIKQWVSRLAPAKSAADVLIDEALSNPEGGLAEAKLREALSLEPGNSRGVIALARILVERSEFDEALTLMTRIPESPETVELGARARLGLTESGVGTEAFAELDTLLDSVKADDDARQRYVDLLATLGEHPKVSEYRRKLAARLF